MEFNFLITLVGLIIITLIDSTYLTLNKDFYSSIIDPNVPINIVYAITTWLLIIISIQLIVLAQDNLTQSKVFVNGILLGLAMYGVYNLTNASLYQDKWNNLIIIGDTLWGMSLTGIMSLILFNIQMKI